MNTNYYCVFDFETCSANPETTEILQYGALMIDPRTLKAVDTFEIPVVKPMNWDLVEDKALEVNHMTREQLKDGIDGPVAWNQFVEWIQKFNRGKTKTDVYRAPIACGYNILGFDLPIIRQYCKRFQPYDDKKNDQKLLNQIYAVDVMHLMFTWTENNPELERLRLTAVQEYLGFPEEIIKQAHGALADVKATAWIMRKLINLSRYLTQPREDKPPILNMKGAYARNNDDGI